jgi:DNA repair exonuclease SbcCD nuclease subunit
LDQADRFQKVFVLSGNHESYGNTVQGTLEAIDAICNERPDVLIHLSKQTYDLEGYVVLGATLWSALEEKEIPIITKMIRDFKSIHNMTAPNYEHRHKMDAYWLGEELYEIKEDGRKAIVLTHHAPTYKNTSAPQYRGTALNSAFATDMEHMMGEPVALWCFGHTHHSSDQIINGTRVVSNQRGYGGERSGFDAGFVIELPSIL